MKYSSPHLHKHKFFEVLQFRLSQYADALLGSKSNQLIPAMTIGVFNAMEQIKRVDFQYDIFGNDFWGYGINRISDGANEYFQPDFTEIKQLPGPNKHHQPYRNCMLLIFRVKNANLALNLFNIDTLYGTVTSDLKELPLKDLATIDIKNRSTGIYLNIHFDNCKTQVSFQIENLHIGGNWLSGGILARYYKEHLEEHAMLLREKKLPEPHSKLPSPNFLADFMHCVRVLYDEGDSVPVIKSHRETKSKDEGAFRNYFCTIFRGLRYYAEPESKKGTKRIDLKVITPTTEEKNIIEFKGWWNNDKKNIINQLCEYLSEFEKNAYVFMVNDSLKSIREAYQQIVCSSEMSYVHNTWTEIIVENSGFSYFTSKHSYGEQGKLLYHVLFNLFPLTETGKAT